VILFLCYLNVFLIDFSMLHDFYSSSSLLLSFSLGHMQISSLFLSVKNVIISIHFEVSYALLLGTFGLELFLRIFIFVLGSFVCGTSCRIIIVRVRGSASKTLTEKFVLGVCH